MAIRQRKDNGKWQVSWRTRSSNPEKPWDQHSKQFTIKRDAERFQARTVVAIERGEYRDEKLGRSSFGGVAATWRAQKVGLKPQSLLVYDASLKNHVLPHFEHRMVAEIDPKMIADWLGTLRAGGTGEDALARAFRILGWVLDLATELRMIPSSPLPRKLKPRPPKSREKRYLSKPEAADLIDATPEHFRPLVLTALLTGMRWGELAGLRVRSVDLLHGAIDVREAQTEVHGRIAIDTPKTADSRRIVDIPASLNEPLEQAIGGKGPDDRVFDSESGTPLRKSNFRQRIWVPACVAAGLGVVTDEGRYDGPVFHDCRHTAVAWAIDAGVHPLEISRRLGHRRASFTMDFYAGLLKGSGRKTADRIDAWYSDAEPTPTTPAIDIATRSAL